MNIELKMLSIGHGLFTYYDTAVIDDSTNQIAFLSLIDSDVKMKINQKELKRRSSIYFQQKRRYYSNDGNKYNFIKKNQSNSDFCHFVAYKKDSAEEMTDSEYDRNNANERITAYIYKKQDSDLATLLMDKLYELTSIPLDDEWKEFILVKLIDNQFLQEMTVDTIYEEIPFKAYKLFITKLQLLDIIQKGLKNQRISINNSTEVSSIMNSVNGLNDYLNLFGDILAEKIQNSFVPKFNPLENDYTEYVNYYDDSCFHKGIELYSAQKATIQASVNNLDKNDVTFVIGEMGIGSFVCI